jgi:hypothetical protein
MAGKKDTDATKNLSEGEPTQALPKGTKTGLPTRKQVENAIGQLPRWVGVVPLARRVAP